MGDVVTGERFLQRRARLVAVVVGGLQIVYPLTTAMAAPAAEVQWSARVLPIVQFVERDRGLTFKHPVPVEFLTPAQFAKKVSGPGSTSLSPKQRKADRQNMEELRALGLVRGNASVSDQGNQLSQADAIGLYVPRAGAVFVRGKSFGPQVRVTLAHELTHVLQDQYYNVRRIESSRDDPLAAEGVVEGDAVRVQQDYFRSMSASDQKSYLSQEQSAVAQAKGATKQIAPFLADSFTFPYDFGPTFAQVLTNDGGNSKVDAALIHPPTSDAQIIDPEHYLAGFRPVKVGAPKKPVGSSIFDGPTNFGEINLLQVLGEVEDYSQAWPAVQGWSGDSMIAYQKGSRVCDLIDTRLATTADAAKLTLAAQRWATTMPGARVRKSGNIVGIASCDPGPRLPAPKAPGAPPYQVLAIRSAFVYQLLVSGSLSAKIGGCTADSLIASFGPVEFDQMLTLRTVNAKAPAQARFIAGLRRSLNHCEA